jgi:hypothetical protein
MPDGDLEDVEKIAQLAVKRGYWDARAALEGVGQARAHKGGGTPRQFLKKLLERTCGLTYDELARLEKDALAPPVYQTPSKPLPRLGAGKPASNVQESLASAEVVIPQPMPSAPAAPQPQAETYTAPPRDEEIITSAKKLPKLGEPRKDASASGSGDGQIYSATPKPLPRLNAPKKKTDAIKIDEPKPEEPKADEPKAEEPPAP